MKRCSTCNRTYTDPNLSFCIEDGTPLTTVPTEDETTVVTPRGNEDDEWNAVAYRPPAPYVPPGTGVKPRRRLWPWIVGIAGAFILGILAISIAAMVLVPRMMRARQNERGRVTVRQPDNSNKAENNNANTAETPSNPNGNSTEHVNTPPPTDREQVLAQLKEVENEWTVANLNADKKKLESILADDYAGQAAEDAGLQTKAEYIENIERDTQVEKWEFSELKLTLTGDRATLSGIITYFAREQTLRFDFTDKFVWRDGRWQATAAELKRRGEADSDL